MADFYGFLLCAYVVHYGVFWRGKLELGHSTPLRRHFYEKVAQFLTTGKIYYADFSKFNVTTYLVILIYGLMSVAVHSVYSNVTLGGYLIDFSKQLTLNEYFGSISCRVLSTLSPTYEKKYVWRCNCGQCTGCPCGLMDKTSDFE